MRRIGTADINSANSLIIYGGYWLFENKKESLTML
jgi:hypothetical protein